MKEDKENKENNEGSIFDDEIVREILDEADSYEFDDTFDESWLVRDNEEFDEKLPFLADRVHREKINYREVDTDKVAVAAILKIMQEELECYSEMTAEEVEYYFDGVIVGCELKALVFEGILDQQDDGKLQFGKGWEGLSKEKEDPK